MREDYQFKYNGCDVSCSMHEDNNVWGGSFTVTQHLGSHVDVTTCPMEETYKSKDKAKRKLMEFAKLTIDKL